MAGASKQLAVKIICLLSGMSGAGGVSMGRITLWYEILVSWKVQFFSMGFLSLLHMILYDSDVQFRTASPINSF